MKSFILIAVLAALSVCNHAASIADGVEPFQEDVVEISEGIEGATGRLWGPDPGWTVLYEEAFDVPGIPNTIQHRDVVFQGNSTTRITRITITFPPPPPGTLFAGNFGSHGHVRLTSAPGGRIGSIVRFYGEKIDTL